MKIVSMSNLSNKSSIPDEVLAEISMASELRANGFQEVLCYQGRSVVSSIGGHWRNQEDKEFEVSSYGSRTLQWNGQVLEKVRPATLAVKASAPSDLIEAMEILDRALNKFRFISGGCLAFLPSCTCISGNVKEIKLPLPNMFPLEVNKLRLYLATVLEDASISSKIETTIILD